MIPKSCSTSLLPFISNVLYRRATNSSTASLTLYFRDVVELRELNVSLVRNGPLMMERTPSRRPTRQRTPTLPSTQPPESPARSSPPRAGPPINPEGPINDSPGPRLSPTYHYQPFTSQSLPPLLEDISPAASPSSRPERRGCGHGVSTSDSYFTFQPMSPSGSPPGLSICAPRLKSLASPALMPPSPLTLSSPPTRSSSPKPASRSVSPLPMYFHHSSPASTRLKAQSTSGSPKTCSFPALSRRASVPEEEAKALFPDSSLGVRGASPTWKPLGLTGMNTNSSSLNSSKSRLSSPALVQGGSASARKNNMSLMGWGLRRNGGGNGKRGFGLVRKGSGSV